MMWTMGTLAKRFPLTAIAAVHFLFLAISGTSAQAATALGEQVTVYYFHSTLRCDTCLFVEALADATLKAEFPDELASGLLVWHPLDLGKAENVHFISEFNPRASEMVVLRERVGENRSWEKIPHLWELASDPERLIHRLKESFLKYIGKREAVQ